MATKFAMHIYLTHPLAEQFSTGTGVTMQKKFGGQLW